jgi:eukaryotic-like serine/threonine-protein kinase
MVLSPGTKLGPYEILAALGSGGMGEVYRARDTKLNRDVALKVLGEAFAQDAERMARFQREAQVLASLNHPNIAAIYGLEDSGGVRALVMELVEGPTLAERIAGPKVGAGLAPPRAPQGAPLQIEEALPIAKQIAEALEAAHEKNTTHRDLKPANVKITPEGTVKVLDFGLAKLADEAVASGDPSNSPTLTAVATQAGMIMGTAAYMAPEQARGQVVDKRADIWSFGVVLFEMLTGQRAFAGETVSDVLASVLKFDPDWTALPASTPPSIIKLLHRCLTKDRKQRLQAIGEARIAIDETLAGGTGVPPVAGHRQDAQATWRRALPWAVAGLLAIAVLVLSMGRWHPAPRPAAMHFSRVTNFAGVQTQPSLSPDGRSVAFVSNRDGHYNIYVGLMSGGSLVQITRDPNLKSHPSWSPDGSTIAFARLNESGVWDVWEVPALGGTPRRVILNATDPAWSPDGHSLAYENLSTGTIWVSSASGQNGRELAPSEPGRFFATEPRFSPDGRQLAFADRTPGPYGELAVADVDSRKVRRLTHDSQLALSPAWSPDGRLIYFASSRGGTLNIWKIGADGSGLQQITAGEGDDAQLDVSQDGKRVVFSTLRENIVLAQLDLQARADEQSVKLLTTDPARNQFGPVYSPDGTLLAYFTNFKGTENESIWLADADGSNAVQLVQDAHINIFPEWTPDGTHLVYMSTSPAGGKGEFRSVPITGGAPQSLPEGGVPVVAEVGINIPKVGRDGRLLFLGAKGQIETFDSRDGKTQTLGTLPGQNAGLLRWSQDEHSVAYGEYPSLENDPNAGVWVYDLKGQPRQVFRGWVIWYTVGSGDEIYLLEGKPDLNGALWKVGWNGKGLVRIGASIPILYNPSYHRSSVGNQFDVSPDGRHVAFQTQPVLEESIGMIENVR